MHKDTIYHHILPKHEKIVLPICAFVMDSIMILMSKLHHKCKRKKHNFS